MDEIAHLDFGAENTTMPPLRQRALEAFKAFTDAAKGEVLHYAQRKLLDVLGEAVANDITVKITNVKDGDGEVYFTIDGLKFQCKVTYPANREPGDEPNTVNLNVEAKGGAWTAVDCLANLGRLLDTGRVG